MCLRRFSLRAFAPAGNRGVPSAAHNSRSRFLSSRSAFVAFPPVPRNPTMRSKYLGVRGGILSETTASLSRAKSREGRGASRRISTISPCLASKRTRVPFLIRRVEHGADLLWDDDLTFRADGGEFHGSTDQLGGTIWAAPTFCDYGLDPLVLSRKLATFAIQWPVALLSLP